MRGEVAIVDGEQLQLPGVHGDDIERLAALVAAALVEREVVAAKLLTVRQVAELLGVPCDFVYRHKAALGAIRLPSGGRNGRLRFDRDTLDERLREGAVVSRQRPGGRRRPARRRVVPSGELLPVRPRQAS